MKNVIIFQNDYEIQLAKDRFGESLKDIISIAWTPQAVDGLNEQGIEFICIQDISNENLDWSNNYKRWGNYATWCSHVDKIISDEIQEFKRLSIKPFLHHYMHKRPLYFNHLFEIDKIFEIKKLPVKKIYYFYYPENEFSPLSRILDQIVLLKDQNKMFFPIHTNKKVNRSIILRDLFTNCQSYETRISKILKEWIKRFLRNFISGEKILSNLTSLLTGISFGAFSTKNSKILVFQENNIEIGPLLQKLKQINDKIDFIFCNEIRYNNKKELLVPIKKILSKIKENNDPDKFLEYRGIDLFPLVSYEIERILKEDLVIYYNNVLCFLELNKKLNFKLVISPYELAILEAIFQQCEVLKIPRIICLHGGTVGVLKGAPPMDEYFRDGGSLHYCFCYTNAIKDYQDDLVKKFGGKVSYVPVGSSHFRRIKKKTNNKISNGNGTIKICLVMKQIVDVGDGLREDARSYKITNDIVNILKNNSNIEVHIKCHSDEENRDLQLFNRLANNEFQNISLIGSNIHFYDIIQNYDLIILNYFGTPFFEVASTKVPVLLFLDQSVYCIDQPAIKLISKRATIVESVEQYLNVIKKLADNNKKSNLFNNKKISNNEFFSKYCYHQKSSPSLLGAEWIQKNILN